MKTSAAKITMAKIGGSGGIAGAAMRTHQAAWRNASAAARDAASAHSVARQARIGVARGAGARGIAARMASGISSDISAARSGILAAKME